MSVSYTHLDDFEESEPFSCYYPNYQQMTYRQLRTYFTWRTKVRQGNIANTSLSYAFVYIYELINQIGVSSPEEGLERLLWFWQTFHNFDAALDLSLIHISHSPNSCKYP